MSTLPKSLRWKLQLNTSVHLKLQYQNLSEIILLYIITDMSTLFLPFYFRLVIIQSVGLKTNVQNVFGLLSSVSNRFRHGYVLIFMPLRWLPSHELRRDSWAMGREEGGIVPGCNSFYVDIDIGSCRLMFISPL